MLRHRASALPRDIQSSSDSLLTHASVISHVPAAPNPLTRPCLCFQALWVSVSGDLVVDARRDIDALGMLDYDAVRTCLTG
jgi:hypothetical protein